MLTYTTTNKDAVEISEYLGIPGISTMRRCGIVYIKPPKDITNKQMQALKGAASENENWVLGTRSNLNQRKERSRNQNSKRSTVTLSLGEYSLISEYPGRSLQAKIIAALMDAQKTKQQLDALKQACLMIDRYVSDDCPPDAREMFLNIIETE